MKNNKFTTAQLTLLGLMIAILLVMSYTPLGYLNIGPLAISFNVIPVAISAIVLGPVGGAVAGGVFGLTSFLQCIGVGGTSAMGVMLFSINPFLAFVQRFIPRLLDGICLGYIFRGMRKVSNTYVACAVTGFFSAFLNTLFFMTSLILFFYQSDYIQNMAQGLGSHNPMTFVIALVGVQGVIEAVVGCLLSGSVGLLLTKALRKRS